MHDTRLSDVLVVYVTCPPDAADALARSLVEDGVAACVNVLPTVTSTYRWQGCVERESESLLLIKTTRARYATLEAAVRAHHPYELPEIVAVAVTAGLPAYLDWVTEMTR